MRGIYSYAAMASAFISLALFTAQETDARGRGGGARSSGASSMSRGGGGARSANMASSSRGGGMSRSGNYSRPSGRASASQLPASGNRGNVNRGNINTGNINRGNINTGNINRGNINNVNVNRDVHVDVDNDWNGWGGYYDHPVARGVAIGAVAGMTAAAIGSRYYALPSGCAPYPYSGLTYYSCGSIWYQPSYQGDTVVYVVVNRPG